MGSSTHTDLGSRTGPYIATDSHANILQLVSKIQKFTQDELHNLNLVSVGYHKVNINLSIYGTVLVVPIFRYVSPSHDSTAIRFTSIVISISSVLSPISHLISIVSYVQQMYRLA